MKCLDTMCTARIASSVIALSWAMVIYGCGVAESSRTTTPIQKPSPASEAQINKQEHLKCEANRDCPVTVWLKKTGASKPPFTFYQFKIRLLNRQPGPSWLVLRYKDSLADSGLFTCYPEEKHCFSTLQLSEAKSKRQAKVIVIHFLGRDDFTAIRVPEGGDILLGEYMITTEGPVSEFEVWEVDSLQVNGKTPLEEWLPYPVMSDRIVHLGDGQKQTVLDYDKNTNKQREDYPNEKVEFVTAHAIRKWLAPVKAAQSRK